MTDPTDTTREVLKRDGRGVGGFVIDHFKQVEFSDAACLVCVWACMFAFACVSQCVRVGRGWPQEAFQNKTRTSFLVG